jgi:poly(A) polymerase
MARKRLTALRWPTDDLDDVVTLVELHLRFHTYAMGWTDSAIRRYVRDAGPLLDRLNALTRADCTTRNEAKAKREGRVPCYLIFRRTDHNSLTREDARPPAKAARVKS